jgi:hypothetical protein
MKKKALLLLPVVFFIIFVTGCQRAQETPDPSLLKTYVAATIQAADIQSTQTQVVFEYVLITSTPGTTSTFVPTLEPRNIIENIVDDIRLQEYCNQELVPEIIKKFRLMDEKSNSFFDFEDANVTVNSPKIFISEADQQLAIERTKQIIVELNSIKVPECMSSAKTKIILGYEELIQVFERNDENWFSDLMAAGFIGQSGRDDLVRIEQCLPTGCK